MTNTVLPITPAIATACDRLEEFVGLFIAVCRDTLPPLGKYEAEIEALNLFKLAVRNIEGVVALARCDLVLLPPALVAARASLEAAVKGGWLVDADDPFDREVRWLAHLASEERYLNRVADKLSNAGLDAARWRNRAAIIRDFHLNVSNKLPKGVSGLSGTPSFEAMLGGLGGEQIYPFYILLSQTTHGEHASTWLFRTEGIGTQKRVGEFVKPSDWWLPLRVCFLALTRPGHICLARLGGDPDRYLDENTVQHIEAQIEGILRGKSQP
jgi:hypothetical protein